MGFVVPICTAEIEDLEWGYANWGKRRMQYLEG